VSPVFLRGQLYESGQDLSWFLGSLQVFTIKLRIMIPSALGQEYLSFLTSAWSSNTDRPSFRKRLSIGGSHPFNPKSSLIWSNRLPHLHCHHILCKGLVHPVTNLFTGCGWNHKTFHRKYDALNCGKRVCKTLLWLTKLWYIEIKPTTVSSRLHVYKKTCKIF